MADSKHVIGVLRCDDHRVLDTIFPEIELAARQIASSRSRVVYIEGDMGAGKTYLASILALQMFWEVHCGGWRDLGLPSGVPLRVVCLAPHSDIGGRLCDFITKLMNESDLAKRGTDPGPHPCQIRTVSSVRGLMGMRNVMCLVAEEGMLWQHEKYARVSASMYRQYPAQILRINPYIHRAQWLGCEPGAFTHGDVTMVRLRHRHHEALWEQQDGSL